MKVLVVGSIEDDAAVVLDDWRRAEHHETVKERALVFESCKGLTQVMTGERYRLLRHRLEHPEPSVSAFARAFGCQCCRVHTDVTALEQAGLLYRSKGVGGMTANRIMSDMWL